MVAENFSEKKTLFEENLDQETTCTAKDIKELIAVKEALEASIKSDQDFISTLDLMSRLTEYIDTEI
ncbi:hypothetical protein QEN19_001586 [Hanseniaspora menglaensis]